jgi:hypothetical protein
MSLDQYELEFFVSQVGASALSVGLTNEETAVFTTELKQGIGYRCLPPASLFPGGVISPQSICTNVECPLAPNADCSAYDFDDGTSPLPALVNGQAIPSSTSSFVFATQTSTQPSSLVASTPMPVKSSHKAVVIGISIGVPLGLIIVGVVAYILVRERRKVKALESRINRMEVPTGFPPQEKLEMQFAVSPQDLDFRGSQRTTMVSSVIPSVRRDLRRSNGFSDSTPSDFNPTAPAIQAYALQGHSPDETPAAIIGLNQQHELEAGLNESEMRHSDHTPGSILTSAVPYEQ